MNAILHCTFKFGDKRPFVATIPFLPSLPDKCAHITGNVKLTIQSARIL